MKDEILKLISEYEKIIKYSNFIKTEEDEDTIYDYLKILRKEINEKILEESLHKISHKKEGK